MHAPGMPGTFSPLPTSKESAVSDPGMHHGTCVTHVPWCMSESPTGGGGENVPGACVTHKFTYLARGPWRPTQHDQRCQALQDIITQGVPPSWTKFRLANRCVEYYYSVYDDVDQDHRTDGHDVEQWHMWIVNRPAAGKISSKWWNVKYTH